uniref:Uncharacterized protein TCIL3000_11_6030 n=1 Tax=Trypanosoma congolense (strain IL3000) TaxID=1068625 RepID=G0V0K9_TRYCI|nr:unnamed protein product [Trypanosoma congolense IL3000]
MTSCVRQVYIGKHTFPIYSHPTVRVDISNAQCIHDTADDLRGRDRAYSAVNGIHVDRCRTNATYCRPSGPFSDGVDHNAASPCPSSSSRAVSGSHAITTKARGKCVTILDLSGSEKDPSHGDSPRFMATLSRSSPESGGLFSSESFYEKKCLKYNTRSEERKNNLQRSPFNIVQLSFRGEDKQGMGNDGGKAQHRRGKKWSRSTCLAQERTDLWNEFLSCYTDGRLDGIISPQEHDDHEMLYYSNLALRLKRGSIVKLEDMNLRGGQKDTLRIQGAYLSQVGHKGFANIFITLDGNSSPIRLVRKGPLTLKQASHMMKEGRAVAVPPHPLKRKVELLALREPLSSLENLKVLKRGGFLPREGWQARKPFSPCENKLLFELPDVTYRSRTLSTLSHR